MSVITPQASTCSKRTPAPSLYRVSSITEVAYLLGTRLGVESEVRFVGDLAAGNLIAEPVAASDWLRVAELALILLYLRGAISDYYDTRIVDCAPADCRLAITSFRDHFAGPVTLAAGALIAAPGLIGIFWGAPLIAREIEERTDRLVWNQSVTRTRWLAVKLGVVALATTVAMGLFSLLLTWSASRYDQIAGGRFEALNFDSRNLVPVGYGLFALVLGTVAGMLVRRTVPAMAIVLAVFAAVQILFPAVIRAKLMTPKTVTVAFGTEVFDRIDGIGLRDDGLFIQKYSIPGGWSMTSEALLLNADGTPYTEEQSGTCLAAGGRE